MLEGEGNFLPPEVTGAHDSENQPEENGKDGEKKEKIVIEKKYDGGDPKAFIFGILDEAHQKGIPLTFKEVLKNIQETPEDTKETEFSFKSKSLPKSSDVIIPSNITFTLEIEKPVALTEEEEEDYDDDFDDYYNQNKKDEEEDKRKTTDDDKEVDIFESEKKKVMNTLNSEDGRLLDQKLEDIKRKGLMMVNRLRELGKNSENPIAESEIIIADRIALFKALEEAQYYGDRLTAHLKEEYNFTPRRDLVPIGYVYAYLQTEYKKNNIQIPDKLLRETNLPGDSPDSIRKAIDIERLK